MAEDVDMKDEQPQATKTKLDTIVSHLDAMKMLITSYRRRWMVKTSVDAPVVRATMAVMIILLSFHLKFHLTMANMIQLHILIGS
jgi:hypothetical protein